MIAISELADTTKTVNALTLITEKNVLKLQNWYYARILPMREKSITGKYIGNAIGYCHCRLHKGALNKELAYQHKCVAKRCKWLEKYNDDAWRKKERYVR